MIKAGSHVVKSIERIESAPLKSPRKAIKNPDEIKVSDTVSSDQKQEFIGLLNDFIVCISDDLNHLGCTDVIEMDIQIEERAKPVAGKPYRLIIS